MPDRQLKYRDRPLLSPPQALGLVLGALAFLAALSPSLIPRTGMLQGAVAGLSFAAKFGFDWLWWIFTAILGLCMVLHWLRR